jgi:GntR family transcriptional regulator
MEKVSSVEEALREYAGSLKIRIQDRAVASIPRYHQLSRLLQQFLRCSKLAPGDRFPSEQVVSQAFGVSRPTANKAVQELVTLGWLRREPGLGSFVAQIPARVLTFLSHNLRLSDSQEQDVELVLASMHVEQRSASVDIASALGIAPGEPVVWFRRQFTVNGSPVLVIESELSENRFPGLAGVPLIDESVFTTLTRHYGCAIHHSVWSVEAYEVLEDEIAELLNLPSFSPVLLLTGIRYTEAEEPVERYLCYISQGTSVKNTVYHNL